MSKTHGLRRTRLYGIWNGILQRCFNPNRQKYKNYGGRGITVCDEWRNSFKAFYDWAMANGYRDDLTIDRIDVNGNYEPSNCRWVDAKLQAYNKTTSKYITYKGETKTLAEWAKEKNIKTPTLHLRLYKSKWSVEKALETPVSSVENVKKPITQLDEQGNIIRHWASAVDASRALGIAADGISQCCLSKRKMVGGYKWSFRKD